MSNVLMIASITLVFIAANTNMPHRDILLDKLPEYNSEHLRNAFVFMSIVYPLLKLQDASSLNHFLVTATSVTGFKALLNILTPDTFKPEYTLPLIIASGLTGINYVGRDYIHVIYICLLAYTLLLLTSRKTTSSNVVFDWALTHASFILSRLTLKHL